ncbi:serine protease inhibitor 3/4-like [Bicyclus anynana]|uniref:Serine protease inhibitor 3/4-like n=1 Tax=Bicyclus anynana TaxID=110368 RepID=A0ABM3LHT0_BICAN|nr:serine protease inhibitor 3/4-like [Bicyclus anynana]
MNVISLAVITTADQKDIENVVHGASSKLTAKMFYEVAKGNGDKSFVLSAYSLLSPLALFSIASREYTQDEIWDTIGTNNDSFTKEVYDWKYNRVKSLKGVTLKTASKICLALNYDVYTDYGKGKWDSFGTELENVDFDSNVVTAREISNWVEEQTNHMIKDIVSADSVNSFTRALLVDAVYFKGQWQASFDNKLTEEKDFYINNKDTSKVQMMYRKGNYKYTKSPTLRSQVIEIPYKDGEASLVVVLPREIEGIKDVQEILKDPDVLDNIRRSMFKAEVDLYLPKFRIETTTNLKDVLEKVNFKRLFMQYGCSLYFIMRVLGNMYISDAVQKVLIEVDEGAETTPPICIGAAIHKQFQDFY